MPPIEETDQSQYNIIPLGGSRRDLEFVIKTNYEQFVKIYPTVKVTKINRTESRPDSLYKELIYKTFDEYSYDLNIYFVFEPPLKLLKKFGIEEEHDALAVMSNRQLNNFKISLTTGDLIQYLGVDYEILTVKLVDYFGNTQVPLNTLATVRQLAKV